MKWSDAKTDADRRRAVLWALERCGGNQGEAAWMLGTRRETINRKLKEWGGAAALRTGVTPSHESQPTQVHNGNGGTGVPGPAVSPNSSAVGSYLTPDATKPHLAGMSIPAATEAPEQTVSGARIPSIQFTPEADEDWFISQEIAVGRLTGGVRTRVSVVKEAVRFYMQAKADAKAEPDKKARK